MSDIIERLKTLDIDLPAAAAPAANYLPYTVSGNLVYISGQLPIKNGEILYKGTAGVDISEEDARKAAELCGINIIAQAKIAAGGDLDNIKRFIKLGGFVASSSTFFNHPKIINAASDLLVNVFGDNGKHARFALGVSALPFGASVEIEAIVELK